MKIAIIVILSLGSALARSCAKEGVKVAEKEGIVAAEKVGAKVGTQASKVSVRVSQIAVSRATTLSARYIARDMAKDSKHVTYNDSTKVITISNIK
jgi:hypothetical protein